MNTMKKLLILASLVPAVLLSGGCTRNEGNRTVLHRETEVAELEAKIAALNDALALERSRPAPEVAPAGPNIDDDLAGTGATVSQRGSEVVITVGNEILFASGSATLTSSAKQSLGRIVQVVNNRYPNNAIRVVGHTDNQPIVRTRDKWSDNWDLSGARAIAVLRQLISAGIPESRIHFAGFGEHQPISGNESRQSRSKNRRVEIIVLNANP